MISRAIRVLGNRFVDMAIGNMLQLFNHNSWGFVDDLIQTHGPVSKCYGFFGVCFFPP